MENSIKSLLLREQDKLSKKSYLALKKLEFPLTYHVSEGSNEFQVELQLLENTPDYLQIMISVDSGKLPSVLLPLSRTFLVYADGRVET